MVYPFCVIPALTHLEDRSNSSHPLLDSKFECSDSELQEKKKKRKVRREGVKREIKEGEVDAGGSRSSKPASDI